MIELLKDAALALQFLTRVPVGFKSLDLARLNRAIAWFPAAGVMVGGAAALCHRFLVPHLGRSVGALIAVLAMVLITGGLHEDGLADCADAFGGGWAREDCLRIMKDSRIGSFGAVALIFSVAVRVLLISVIPLSSVTSYMISAQVLARWTPVPLSMCLQTAREGLGRSLARRVSWTAAVCATTSAVAIAWFLLRGEMMWPVVAVAITTALSAVYYYRRIGGVTGDCMGATIQLAEIAVYLCGAWAR